MRTNNTAEITSLRIVFSWRFFAAFRFPACTGALSYAYVPATFDGCGLRRFRFEFTGSLEPPGRDYANNMRQLGREHPDA